jgi:hypothetical protein
MAKAVALPLAIPCAGKFGDLAGFTSAIILAMIALLIGYESVTRFFDPVPIHFEEAIPIAFLGLVVNIASAWLYVEAPPDPVEATSELLPDKVDRYLLGNRTETPPAGRLRSVSSRRVTPCAKNVEISALETKCRK